MDYIVVTGAKPYDGRYEFELKLDGLTTLEWGWIKRYAGYMPLTVLDGFRGGDAELFTMLAVIAMHRNATITDQDVPDVYAKLQRLSFEDTITMEPGTADEVEDGDADPPASESASSNGSSRGDSSRATSDPSAPAPTPTGIPASGSSVSVPAMSAG